MRRVAVRSKHIGRPRMRISLRLAFFAASLEVGSSVQTETCIRPTLLQAYSTIAKGTLYISTALKLEPLDAMWIILFVPVCNWKPRQWHI